MKSKKSVRNSGGGNATSAASGSRDRSGGMASSRVGSSKDSSIRHASNRPMSSSPSRLAGESHYQQRSANYHNQQQGGDSNLAASGSSSVADGVYSNKRLMHACTCLIGTTVQVETIDGNVHEGLFRIFSPELEITLEQAHLIDPKSPTTITCEAVKEIMIFEMKEVLHMSAIGVDLDYAAKDGFQTDTQISSKNNGEGGVGGGSNFRELKEFEFDDTFSMNDEGLEGSFSMEKDRALEDGSNGWRAEDMFSMNEKKYGVQTSYKENLEGYTVQLKQSEKSSDEYRNREARAERLAREIEGTQASHLAAELENGDDDEESAFSAVQRGPSQKTDVRDSDTGGKYMPPARRQSNSGSNSGSMPSKQHPNSGISVSQGTNVATKTPKHKSNQLKSKSPSPVDNGSKKSKVAEPALSPVLIKSMSSTASDITLRTSFTKAMSAEPSTTPMSGNIEKSKLNPSAKEFILTSPVILPHSASAISTVITPDPGIQTHFSPNQNFSQRPITPGHSVCFCCPQHAMLNYQHQNSSNYQGNVQIETALSTPNAVQGNQSFGTIQQHAQVPGQLIQYVQNAAAYQTLTGVSNVLSQPQSQIAGTQVPINLSMNAQETGSQSLHATMQPQQPLSHGISVQQHPYTQIMYPANAQEMNAVTYQQGSAIMQPHNLPVLALQQQQMSNPQVPVLQHWIQPNFAEQDLSKSVHVPTSNMSMINQEQSDIALNSTFGQGNEDVKNIEASNSTNMNFNQSPYVNNADVMRNVNSNISMQQWNQSSFAEHVQAKTTYGVGTDINLISQDNANLPINFTFGAGNEDLKNLAETNISNNTSFSDQNNYLGRVAIRNPNLNGRQFDQSKIAAQDYGNTNYIQTNEINTTQQEHSNTDLNFTFGSGNGEIKSDADMHSRNNAGVNTNYGTNGLAMKNFSPNFQTIPTEYHSPYSNPQIRQSRESTMIRPIATGNVKMLPRPNDSFSQNSGGNVVRYQHTPTSSRPWTRTNNRSSTNSKHYSLSTDAVQMPFTPSRQGNMNYTDSNRRYSQSTPIRNRQYSLNSARTSSGENAGSSDASTQAYAASLPVKYFHRSQC